MEIKKAIARAKNSSDPRKGRRVMTVSLAVLKQMRALPQFNQKFIEGRPKHKSYDQASNVYSQKRRPG